MKRLEEKLARFGIRPGLERIEKICVALGRPQDNLKVILVTGTNGKGSVVAALSSILHQAGHKTGAYFSPHIVRYNERFRVDEKEISDAEFARYEEEILRLHDSGYEMTLFEALTAIAYKYFSDMKCEYAVMEIGMGGRHDATNIAMEKMAIITNVDLEHTDYLGKTVGEIAYDKSHIIKNPQGLAITSCEGEALDEVKKRAGEIGAPLRILGFVSSARRAGELVPSGTWFRVSLKESLMEGCVFDFSLEADRQCSEKNFERLFIPLAGKHQAKNAALAIAAAIELGIDENSIREGLKKTRHIGRLQIIEKNPLVVVDGAHNPDGIRTLIRSLDIYPRERLVCVFSALKDKDWKTMLSILAPLCDSMVINQMKNDRAEKADMIAQEALRYTQAEVVEDIASSVRAAKRKAGKNGMVLVCGSLYMLGEVLAKSKQ